MSSKTSIHPTRIFNTGTYMSLNGRNIYAETHSLEDCFVNFQPDELSPKIRERLREVFPTTDDNQTYITIAFDYSRATLNNKEMYILSGFWNPNIGGYEFEQEIPKLEN